MLQTIYFARHGARPMDLFTAPSATDIPGDVALTDVGRLQAQELADFFVRENISVDQIYSSSFYRAIETVNPLAEALDLPIRVEPGFGEVLFDDGRHPYIPFRPELAERFPRIAPEAASDYSITAVQENLDQITERVRSVITPLVAKLDKEGVKSIFIISHASPNHAIASALKSDITKEKKALTWDMCGLSKIDRRPDGSWKFDWQSRTDFLSGGAVNGFEIQYEAL